MKSLPWKHIRIYSRIATAMVLSTGFAMAWPVLSDAAPPDYTIQVGAFKDSYNALKLTAALTGKGEYAICREEGAKAGDNWHKVYLGQYKSRESALKAFRTFKIKKTIPATSFILVLPGMPAKSTGSIKPEERPPIGEGAPVMAMIPEKQMETVLAEAPAARKTVSPSGSGVAGNVTPAREPAPVPSTPSPPPDSREDFSQIFPEKMMQSRPVTLTEIRRDQQKNWHLSAGYSLWYVDMSSRYTNSGLAGSGYLHGPNIGVSWEKLTLQSSALFSANNLDGNRTGQYTDGSGYSVTDRLRRYDYDALVKYRIDGPKQLFSLSPLVGFKYTRFDDMNSAYTRSTGQQYTLTGHMDIWGPTLGLEVLIPLGKPQTTPLSLSLSGSGMYLRATGKYPGHWPAQGGSYWTTFDGADFSSWGWGGTVDAHLTWTIFDALQFLAGGRFQSADLTDTSPAGTTMRVSNGYIGAYGNLNLTW